MFLTAPKCFESSNFKTICRKIMHAGNQMHSLHKCKINLEEKELKLNVVSVKLSQYLDNLICNQN